MKLTARQRAFADEYLVSNNATRAAIEAGYSKRSAGALGANLLKNVNVKAYIEEKMEEISSDKIMDAKEILELFTRIARGEEKEVVVMPTPIGVESVEKPPDNRQKMTAAKELLKRFPDSDRLLDAQVRKAEAEAAIAEKKAELMQDTSGNVIINIDPFNED